ncbi:MAG: bifunctional glycosyltransferase family 2 protein/CDP-glycerol:glycerophosphate glycerophosphotransferase [Lactobacillales bacterium]|nr:bifunctional glycosyltransferase family 2 protein/CDP-glycerol:glycerophosphate glycerophosphotransferase [Lactobacillales bacterium]
METKDIEIDIIEKRVEELPEKYKNNNFLFSIIMATYNVSPYIDEALRSLENQLLNFRRNVQVVIVNDGSTDNSLEKALIWEKKYPQNIVVIDKENGGVSSARNIGIEVATGKYINFLDPDDMLDEGTLLEIKIFFQKNQDVNIVHIPLMLFEAQNGPHTLNHTFEKDTEIVDINNKPKKIFVHISSSFVKRSLFADDTMRFEIGRKYGEDLALIAKLVEQEQRFGLVNNVYYRYRARNAGDSAMDSSRNDPETYIPNAEMMLKLIHQHESIDNSIDSWLQNVIMYDLAWKVRREELPFEPLDNFYEVYFDRLYEILQFIDESVIRSIGHLKWFQKEALVFFKNSGKLSLKGHTVGAPIVKKDDVVLLNGEKNYFLSNLISKIYVIKYRAETDSLNITGTIDHLFGEIDLTVTATDGVNVFESTVLSEPARIKLIGLPIHALYTYNFDIPLKNLKDSEFLKIEINFKNVIRPLKVEFSGMLVSIGNKIEKNYIFAGNKLIRFNFKQKCFEIKENCLDNIRSFELEMSRIIYGIKKTPLEQLQRINYLRKIALQSKLSNKVINIFQDREDKADDNAEVFYKYVQEKHPEWDNYFVLERQSHDWQRLELKGFKLIEYGSKLHEELLIQAQNLISSQANLTVMRPWEKHFGYLRDAYHYNFIFLQHGVTKHDLSLWLRKIEKDIRILVTVSEYEKEGFLDYGYEYTVKEVKDTGFPRFDRFDVDFSVSKKTGEILISPTWRNGIWEDTDELDVKIDKLKETEFYQLWQELLLSEELLDLYNSGNSFSLLLHPLLREVESAFIVPNYINVIPFEERYVDALKKADLLLTDYSSIYFDIAYQGKPTLYYQFDGGNVNNKVGYFDFETMGFGKVCNTLEEVTEEMKNVANNKFQMKKLYKERVQNFFSYTDSKNSERLLNELEILTKETSISKENIFPSYSNSDIENLFITMEKLVLDNKIVGNPFMNRIRIFAKKKFSKDGVLYNISRNIYRRVK